MYALKDSHVEFSRTAMTEMLASDQCTLSRAERRKCSRLLNLNDWRYTRRMAAFTSNVGAAMFDAHDEAMNATVEGFGAFIDIVQNWIQFFVDNQDKIMEIVNFIAKLIPMIMLIFAGQAPEVAMMFVAVVCLEMLRAVFGSVA